MYSCQQAASETVCNRALLVYLLVDERIFLRNKKKDLCFTKVIVIATSTSYIENFLNGFVLFFVSAIFWDDSYSVFVINLIYSYQLLR